MITADEMDAGLDAGRYTFAIIFRLIFSVMSSLDASQIFR